MLGCKHNDKSSCAANNYVDLFASKLAQQEWSLLWANYHDDESNELHEAILLYVCKLLHMLCITRALAQRRCTPWT